MEFTFALEFTFSSQFWLKILKLLKIQKREQKVQIFRNVRQETWKNNCGNSGKHAAGPDERADVITFYGQEFSQIEKYFLDIKAVL